MIPKVSRLRVLAFFLSLVLFCTGILLTLGIFLPIAGFVSIKHPLFSIGHTFFSVYRFSAFLIPLLFLYGAVLLLIPGWSRESKIALLGVPLYFITAIIGERIIYTFAPAVSIPLIRQFVVISLILCILLLICFEIFFMLTVSEKLPFSILFRHAHSEDFVSEDYETEDDGVSTGGAEEPVPEQSVSNADKAEANMPVPVEDTGACPAPADTPLEASAEIPETVPVPETAEEDAASEAVNAEAAAEEELLPFLEEADEMHHRVYDYSVEEFEAECAASGDTECAEADAAELDRTNVPAPPETPAETGVSLNDTESCSPREDAAETAEAGREAAAAAAAEEEEEERPPLPVFDPSDPDNLFSSLEEITAPLERVKQGEYHDTDPAVPSGAALTAEDSASLGGFSVPQAFPAEPDGKDDTLSVAEAAEDQTGIAAADRTEAEPDQAAPEAAAPAEADTAVQRSNEEPATENISNGTVPLMFTNGVPVPNEMSDLLDSLVVIEQEPAAGFAPVQQKVPASSLITAEPAGYAEAEEHDGTEDVFDDESDELGGEGTEAGVQAVPSDEVFLEKIEQAAVIPSKPVLPVPRKKYAIPFDLLTNYPDGEYWVVDDATRKAAMLLKSTFNEFKIDVSITGIRKGPVVTMFEMLPSPGIKLSKITNLQDNIALRLAASSVRIVAPIPGKHAVGIEVPNKKRSIVSFRELIETDLPESAKMAIPVVLGKDVTGNPQLLDLAQTPHLLIAGATGSGKSVCVNSIILSILYNRRPDEVKLILVDPKIVELKLYNDIAHLLTPVITEPKRAFQALQYALCEMERRYALLDNLGVRDIRTFNAKIKAEKIATEVLPYIVIIIDEFADLMATSGKELEATVARLCAMSRAVGIHLVLATQRPSIDVITGLIKANIPSRIAFMVASKTDSRIILDEMGAEKLLGKGDMLYVSAARPFPTRMQGAFVSEQEVERVVACVKEYCEPEYIDDEIFVDDDDESFDNTVFSEDNDPLYDQALEIVTFAGKASASYVQRKLKIGYNRAARLIEEMEARGIVGPANGSKAREILRHP
ncbi:MAG: DNA translocase FtsK [Treponema sp.]